MQYGNITECAAISCSTSYSKEIDAETLVNLLSGETPGQEWQFHLDTFFNELPPEYIQGVLSETGLTMEQLANVFHSLPDVLQGGNFKRMLSHG